MRCRWKTRFINTLPPISYFQDVLQSALLSSDDNEIQLNQDGSWSTHVEKNGICTLESPQKPAASAAVQKVEVISLDLDSTIETPSQTNAVQSNMLKMCLRGNQGGGSEVLMNGHEDGAQNGAATETTNDTVDLTLSDSEEEDSEVPQRSKRLMPGKK